MTNKRASGALCLDNNTARIPIAGAIPIKAFFGILIKFLFDFCSMIENRRIGYKKLSRRQNKLKTCFD